MSAGPVPIPVRDLAGIIGADILAHDVVRLGPTTWRVLVTLRGAARRNLVIKMAPASRAESERAVYTRLGALLPDTPTYVGYLPTCHGIVLEHIPLRVFDWQAGPTLPHSEAAVDALARIHTLKADTAWLPAFDGLAAVRIAAQYDDHWRSSRPLLTRLRPGLTALGDQLYRTLTPVLARLAGESLLHGDANGENLAERADGHGVSVLDWQDAARGCASVDLANYVVMSYPVPARRSVETVLIERHANLLGLDSATAREHFRLGVLHRLVRMVGHAASHPHLATSSLPWTLDRCTSAALDWDVQGVRG